jgi:hypothetical protein
MPSRTVTETRTQRLATKHIHKKSRCGGTPEGIRPHRLTLQRTPRHRRVALYLVIRRTFLVTRAIVCYSEWLRLDPTLAPMDYHNPSGSLASLGAIRFVDLSQWWQGVIRVAWQPVRTSLPSTPRRSAGYIRGALPVRRERASQVKWRSDDGKGIARAGHVFPEAAGSGRR